MPRGGTKRGTGAAFTQPPELVDLPGQAFPDGVRQRKAGRRERRELPSDAVPARAKISAMAFLSQFILHLVCGAILFAFVWFFVFDAPLPTMSRLSAHDQYLLQFLEHNDNMQAHKSLRASTTSYGDPPKWWAQQLSRTMGDLVDNQPLSEQQTKDIILAATIEELGSRGRSGGVWVNLFATLPTWIARSG